MLFAVGDILLNNFQNAGPGAALRFIGFRGGWQNLDLAFAVIEKTPLPGWWKPPAGINRDVAERKLRIDIRLALLDMTAKTNAEVARVCQLKREVIATFDDDGHDPLKERLRLFEKFFKMKGLTAKRRRTQGKQAKARCETIDLCHQTKGHEEIGTRQNKRLL
ncbi:MAG: hypothetical protein ACJ8C4_09905 [Gemmataceae bacterium]